VCLVSVFGEYGWGEPSMRDEGLKDWWIGRLMDW
jgi:hypothetical protein